MSLRILFLQHPGHNSRQIFADIIEGYREAGNQVFVLELAFLWEVLYGETSRQQKEDASNLYTKTVHAFLAANRIDLCVSLWGNGALSLARQGEQSFFEHAGMPCLMHWLDAPQWAHHNTALDVPRALFNGPNSYHVINNPGTAREMEAVLGFSNVIPLANAASPDLFRPCADEKKEYDIVFGVGEESVKPTGVMLAELAKDEPDIQAIRADVAWGLKPRLCGILAPRWNHDAHVERFVERMLEARLHNRDEEVLAQFAAVAHLEKDLAPRILSVLQDPKLYVAFSMALRSLDNWERAFTFCWLARRFRCATFGSDAFAAWPGEWDRLGKLPYEQQARVYSRARFGLNVMRWQDDIGLNLKPFEITLSGACLLQGYRRGIEELFDDSQIIVFRTPQECRRRIEELLADPERLHRMIDAGRRQSLARHCWKHRAAEITRAFTAAFDRAGRVRHGADRVEHPTNGSSPEPRAAQAREMRHFQLAFVLGAWRTGTTLLRKLLDSHSRIYSPAETWFLLPLLQMWEGHDDGGQPYNARQAAAAIQGHVTYDQHLDCCRAFAERFYSSLLPPKALWFVDKTPHYLKLADVLPRLFPDARFLVLTRDPRDAAWSRHTWKHVQSRGVESHFPGVAGDTRTLARFLNAHSGRSLHVRYEDICRDAGKAMREVCRFLDLDFEPGMIDYGGAVHHEGYGDEKSRGHRRPHTDSLARWEAEAGLTLDQQRRLAAACGAEAVRTLGYAELADLLSDSRSAAQPLAV